MSFNLSIREVPCSGCGGDGLIHYTDPNTPPDQCSDCEGTGGEWERRTNLEIAEQHLLAAERSYDQAEKGPNKEYHIKLAEYHMELARTYALVAQADAMRQNVFATAAVAGY